MTIVLKPGSSEADIEELASREAHPEPTKFKVNGVPRPLAQILGRSL